MGLLERVKAWLPGQTLETDETAKEPTFTVEVAGFEATIERKSGMILTITNMKDKAAPSRPGAVDYYYEIKVRKTGENPEYPASPEPTLFRATLLLPGERNWGAFGNTVFMPHDARLLGFRLVEEFDSGERPSALSTQLPPHHATRLKVDFEVTSTGITHSLSAGGWARKSDRETDAWKAVTASPLSW